MKIIDLTAQYHADYIVKKDRKAYENSFPDLFRHYFQFWTRRDLDIAIVHDQDILTRKMWINQFTERLTGILEKLAIDSNAIHIVYFIGVGTTNGHAFEHEGRFYVWLPLETYTTERRVPVFVAHEIVHALHYQNSHAFYFHSKEEQIHMSRQLITEGLATYLSRQLLGVSDLEALWADYLNEHDTNKWWRTCEEGEENLYRLIRENYYKSNGELELFYASNPDNIYQFRAGYYAGLRLIDEYMKSRSLSAADLLALPREGLERDIFELLQ